MEFEEAQSAILAELKRGGTIYSADMESRLPGHSVEDVELAAALLEGDEKIIVLRESTDRPHPYSFSGFMLSPQPT